MIQQAKKFIYEKYKDKYLILHAIETYRIIELLYPADQELQTAAILHDILEDTNTTYKELVSLFGRGVANLVEEVTKSKYNTFPKLKTQRGYVLKFADRLDNLSHLENWDLKRKCKYFRKSRFWKTK